MPLQPRSPAELQILSGTNNRCSLRESFLPFLEKVALFDSYFLRSQSQCYNKTSPRYAKSELGPNLMQSIYVSWFISLAYVKFSLIVYTVLVDSL